MEPIVYDTEMNAPGEVIGRAIIMTAMTRIPIIVNCHTKGKRSFKLHRNLTTLYVRLVWDAPLLSRPVLRAVYVGHTSE